MTTEPDINQQLEAHRRRLWARQVLRRAALGTLAGAGVVLVSALLGALVPLLSLLGLLAGVSTALGFTLHAVFTLRPRIEDAALELESRLEDRPFTLITAVQVRADSPFRAAVATRAGDALRLAQSRPGVHLLSVPMLLALPLAVLVAATAVLAVQPRQAAPAGGTELQTTRASTVDIGGSRTDDDARALREAMGLQTASEALQEAAAHLQQQLAGDATDAGTQQALDTANDALDLARQAGFEPATELPDVGPDATLTPEQRAELAEALEAIAAEVAGFARRARERGERGGSQDSGSEGDFDVRVDPSAFTPFPPPDQRRFETTSSFEIAAQTPARRALVQRATEHLER